jgi:hypothetical protein
MALTGAAPIAEAVSLLNKVAPHELERLRNELPADMAPFLSGAGVAGPLPANLRARATVQLAALAQIIERIKSAIRKAEGRLKISRRIRLAGDVCAIVGSSSVLVGASGGTQSAPSSLTVMVSGCVALLGALAGALSEYALKLPDGGASLFEIYAGLGEAQYEAEQLAGGIHELIALDSSEESREMLEKLVGEANVLCRKMQKSFALVLHTS